MWYNKSSPVTITWAYFSHQVCCWLGFYYFTVNCYYQFLLRSVETTSIIINANHFLFIFFELWLNYLAYNWIVHMFILPKILSANRVFILRSHTRSKKTSLYMTVTQQKVSFDYSFCCYNFWATTNNKYARGTQSLQLAIIY